MDSFQSPPQTLPRSDTSLIESNDDEDDVAAAPGPMRTTSPPQYEQQQQQQQQQAKPGHMAKMQSGPVTGASDDGGEAGGEPVGYNAAEFKVREAVVLDSLGV